MNLRCRALGRARARALPGVLLPGYDTLVGRRGRVCLPIFDDDDYRIYRLRTRRRAQTDPVVQVHSKGGATPRILGVVRLEQ